MRAHEPPVKIQLFGPFRVWIAGQLLPPEAWHTETDKTLLKIMAGERGRYFSQDELIERIWPDGDPIKAANSLRRRVTEVRRILEPNLSEGRKSQYILTRRDGYCFNPEAPCWIDVEEFSRQLAQGQRWHDQGDADKAAVALQTTVDLHVGDYLSEDPYAEWVIPLRTHWQEQLLEALSLLAESHAGRGHYRRAIASCRQILRRDPYREGAYRMMMLYAYLSGSPGDAARAYDECVLKLKELGTEPTHETRQLQEQIRAGHIPEIEQEYEPAPLVRHEIPYRLSPASVPFIGRMPEYAQLVQHLEESRKAHGRCVLIAGEAGVGKTRLVQELLASARKRMRVNTFFGRCHEQGVPLAFQVWAEAIRDGLKQLQSQDLRAVLPLWLAEVSSIVPELRVRLPSIPQNPELPRQQQQLRFYEGLTQFFFALVDRKSARKPLVLMLDDLQWADSASLEFLNYFLSRIETRPLLILATCRSEELLPDHALNKLVNSWLPRGLLFTLALNRLGREEVKDLLTKLPLAADRAEIYSTRLYEESHGNPLFLIAMLQHLLEEGALRVQGGSWVAVRDLSDATLKVPATVKELIVRRLRQLGESEQKLLQLASAIGRDFECALLEQAWEGNGDCVTLLDGLTKAQLLVERQGRYEFTHDKFREVVYEDASHARRQQLHRQVLRALEQFYVNQQETAAALMAQHAFQSRQWNKVMGYAVQALKRAVKEYHHGEGLEVAELGLKAANEMAQTGAESAPVDAQRFELLSLRLEIHDILGERERQKADLQEMQQLSERWSDKSKLAHILHKRADLHYSLGAYGESETAAMNALELYRALGDQSGTGAALNTLGNVYHDQGRYGDALEHHKRALEIFRELGDRKREGRSLNSIGHTYYYWGRYDDARHYYQQALEVRNQVGDRQGQAHCLNGIANTYYYEGRFEEELRYYEQALRIFQEIGDQQGQGYCLNNIGIVYQSLGQCEEALRHQRQALEILRRIGDQQSRAYCLNALGSTSLDLGQLDEALQHHQSALKIFAEIGDEQGQAYCSNSIGDVHRQRKQHREALQHYAQGRSMLEGLGAGAKQLSWLSAAAMAHLALEDFARALEASSEALHMLAAGERCENPQAVYYHHYKVLTAHSRDEEATGYLQKAYDEVMRRAQRITDARLRESFLNVQLNREILTAWEGRQ